MPWYKQLDNGCGFPGLIAKIQSINDYQLFHMVYFNPGGKRYLVIPPLFLNGILSNNYIGSIPKTTGFNACLIITFL